MDSINEAIAMMEQFDKRNTEMAEQLAKQIAELVAQIETITARIKMIAQIVRVEDVDEYVEPDAG